MKRGRAIARLLAGSWRTTRSPTPPPLPTPSQPSTPTPTPSPPTTAALDDCASLLLEGGAAALVWARVRDTPLAQSASAALLRDAHRMQTLLAAVQRRQLATALAALSSVGVTPLCAKGWSVARHYGDPALRAVGDIDLYVAPAQHARAAAALATVEGAFDLHAGIPQLSDRDFAEVAARAEAVAAGDQIAHVLSPADQLRLVCLHALGHGAWRPLWLCDVGALVEAGGVDWDVCLAGSPRRAHWVACAIVAARELLEADLVSVPASVRAARLPSWMVPAIVDAWSARHRPREPIATYWWRLLALPLVLWHRWPNPIEASVDVEAEFDEAPRLPLQLADCAQRIGRFARAVVRDTP